MRTLDVSQISFQYLPYRSFVNEERSRIERVFEIEKDGMIANSNW